MAVLHRASLALALVAVAREANAAPCTPVIHGLELPAAWRRAADTVNGELAARTDIERCVEIDLRIDPDGQHASLVVTLGAQRAIRALADPTDLRATVLALLLEPAPPSPQPEPTHVEPESAPAVAPVVIDPPRAARVIVHESATPIAVDVGIAIGALWTDGGAHPSVAATIRESRGTWSAGVLGRLATSSGSDSMAAPASDMSSMPAGATSSREVAVDIGRRFELGGVALTVSAGPSLVMLEKVETSTVAKTHAVRADGGLRMEPASFRHVGLYVAIDASFDLGRLPETSATGLPTWSMGFTLGGELRAWP